MSGHTPGPWRLVDRGTFGKFPMVVRGNEGGFAVQGLSPESEDADARLIAAAPDLYNALLSVLDSIGALSNEYELNDRMSEDDAAFVWAALKKATQP